jgi:hypothetical protein
MDDQTRTEEPIMANMTKTPAPRKTTARRTVRRRAASQHLSDHRYYVQCAYRLTMAIISLIALIIVTH